MHRAVRRRGERVARSGGLHLLFPHGVEGKSGVNGSLRVCVCYHSRCIGKQGGSTVGTADHHGIAECTGNGAASTAFFNDFGSGFLCVVLFLGDNNDYQLCCQWNYDLMLSFTSLLQQFVWNDRLQ